MPEPRQPRSGRLITGASDPKRAAPDRPQQCRERTPVDSIGILRTPAAHGGRTRARHARVPHDFGGRDELRTTACGSTLNSRKCRWLGKAGKLLDSSRSFWLGGAGLRSISPPRLTHRTRITGARCAVISEINRLPISPSSRTPRRSASPSPTSSPRQPLTEVRPSQLVIPYKNPG